MRVAIVAEPAERESLVPIQSVLTEAGVDAVLVTAGLPEDERSAEELKSQLRKTSHLLFYVGAAPKGDWYPYLAGYAQGSDQEVAVYLPSFLSSLPPYLRAVPAICSLSELAAFYESAEREWESEKARHAARTELLEQGISVREDSFAECVIAGNQRAVSLFLRAGFSPDTHDKHGVPMICLAVRAGHLPIFEILVEAGANLNIQSEDRGNSPAMDAAAAGKVDLLRALAASGADLNLLSKDGQTALVIAVGKNNVEAVRALIESGADPDIEDKLGFSARKYAKLFHNEAVVSLIEGAKA
jgi:uncharacterized protein